MATSEQRRALMVARQIAARGVKDPRVLDAMRTIAREDFVPGALAEFAYDDSPLPIEAGQTISQPYIVALMVEAAQIRPDDHVLEIGAGSGYAAAVMSRLAGQVHAIERHGVLADLARKRMASHGCDNVVIRTGDGTNGWPENAPFDVILVAAGAPALPEPLREQLAIGGRLVIPVGDAEQQTLVRVTRISAKEYAQEDLGPVRFVRLIGAHGWKGDGGGGAPAGSDSLGL
jgi:protein-L-isoaspartate(D-aspartate) O-methyltransferase